MADRIFPVILSGGAGSRLWPLSREASPKQLLKLAGPRTLLQETALRLSDPDRYAPPIVVAGPEHRFVIAEQLREIGLAATLAIEPEARHTGPAAAAGVLLAAEHDPDALVLVAHSDHVILDGAAFQAAINRAAEAAREGAMVLFAVTPTSPNTGYGYIEKGEEAAAQVWRIARFQEKPDLATAETYLASGRHGWNSGIFLLPARSFLAALERFEPRILAAARAAVQGAARDADFVRLEPRAWADAPAISIDHAVMERADGLQVTTFDCGWTDVGAWSALWEIGEKDGAGNVAVGDVIAKQAEGCYLRSEGPLVAAVGVSDLVVVATADAVLVVGKAADQGVKTVVETLRAEGRRGLADGIA